MISLQRQYPDGSVGTRFGRQFSDRGLKDEAFYVDPYGVWDKRGGAETVKAMMSVFETRVAPLLAEYEGQVSARLAQLSFDEVLQGAGLPFGMGPGHAAELICWFHDKHGDPEDARPFRQQWCIKEGEYVMDFHALLGDAFSAEQIDSALGKRK